jgi:hypothetical protein
MNIATLSDRLNSALTRGGDALDGAIHALAGAASTRGELDADKLERFQGEAPRAAQLHAQWRAAKAALHQSQTREQLGLRDHARVLSIFEGTEEVLGLKVIIPALLKPHLA